MAVALNSKHLTQRGGWNTSKELLQVSGQSPSEAIGTLCDTLFTLTGPDQKSWKVQGPALLALRALHQTTDPVFLGPVFDDLVAWAKDHGALPPSPEGATAPLLGSVWLAAWTFLDHQDHKKREQADPDWPDALIEAAGGPEAGPARLMREALTSLSRLCVPVDRWGLSWLGEKLCKIAMHWDEQDLTSEQRSQRQGLFHEAILSGWVKRPALPLAQVGQRTRQRLAFVNLWEGEGELTPSEQLTRFVDALVFVKGDPMNVASHAEALDGWLAQGAQLNAADPYHAQRQAALRERQPALHARLRQDRTSAPETLGRSRRRRPT